MPQSPGRDNAAVGGGGARRGVPGWRCAQWPLLRAGRAKESRLRCARIAKESQMNSCRIRVHIAAIALLYVPPTWAQQFRPSGSPQAQPPAPSTAPIPIVCDWKAYSRDDLIEQASRLRESALSVIAVEPPLQGCIGSAALVLGYTSETADLRSLTAYIEREVRVIESSRMTFRSGTVASVITAIGRRARLAVQVGKALLPPL
jgi:hypothetical protein